MDIIFCEFMLTVKVFLCQLYYHGGSLLTYMGLKHDGEVNSKVVDGVQVSQSY